MKTRHIFSLFLTILMAYFAFPAIVSGQDIPLSFSVFPSDQYVCEGVDAVHFFADSDSPRAKFQWQFRPQAGGSFANVVGNEIMIPNYNKLTVTGSAITDYEYRCILKDNFIADADSVISQAVKAIVIMPPQAGFSTHHPKDDATISTFCSNALIQFRDQSTVDVSSTPENHIVKWEWVFENEVFSLEPEPMYLFTEKGQQQVTLTVWDSFACMGTYSSVIDIRNESVQINGPEIVCGNQFTIFEAEMKDWSINNDIAFHWNFEPSSLIVESTVMNEGKTIVVHWAETNEARQLNIQVMAWSKTLNCYAGKIVKPVLLSSKKSPDEVIALIRKNPDDPNNGLMIAIVEDIDTYDFRWGLNNTWVSSDEDATNFYDFGSFNPGNTYWVDIKYKNTEACWTRKVYQAGE